MRAREEPVAGAAPYAEVTRVLDACYELQAAFAAGLADRLDRDWTQRA
ncbi:hypothetical protein [Streptomyces flaveolus]